MRSIRGRMLTSKARPRDERPVRGPSPPCPGERAHRSRSPRRVRPRLAACRNASAILGVIAREACKSSSVSKRSRKPVHCAYLRRRTSLCSLWRPFRASNGAVQHCWFCAAVTSLELGKRRVSLTRCIPRRARERAVSRPAENNCFRPCAASSFDCSTFLVAAPRSPTAFRQCVVVSLRNGPRCSWWAVPAEFCFKILFRSSLGPFDIAPFQRHLQPV